MEILKFFAPLFLIISYIPIIVMTNVYMFDGIFNNHVLKIYLGMSGQIACLLLGIYIGR